MSTENRVILVRDPFSIFHAEAERVAGIEHELRVFREIDRLLKSDSRFETIQPRTYVVAEACWEHFRSYHGVAGVRVDEITPRRRLREKMGAEPPEWLTDGRVLQWDLMAIGSTEGWSGDWVLSVASWLVPGIRNAASLSAWLRAASSSSIKLEQCPLLDWLKDSLGKAMKGSTRSNEIIDQVVGELHSAPSLAVFAQRWMRCTALLPLTEMGIDRPLLAPGVPSEPASVLVAARQLPLVFPLVQPLHTEVSAYFRKALQRCRLEQASRFEAAVLALNALWDGIAEELKSWLQARPGAMTRGAAKHLRGLAGYGQNDLAQQLVTFFEPADAVGAWPGVGADFDAWVAKYATFVRRAFCRRELPKQDADPALGFAEWIKANPGVCFNHLDRGYRYLARRVQGALKKQRCVIVVLVDALAIHILQEAIDYLGDCLHQQPAKPAYVFAPVPTISEVCKEAVLTGAFPNECRGGLLQGLCRAYGLPESQIKLAANWEDAERLQLTRQTRLVVYRDNRLDDQLRTTATYQALVEDCPGVFVRMARLIARWVSDFSALNGSNPVVLLTADHGFTFGPGPGTQTSSARKLDGAHRCVELTEPPTATESNDGAMIYLDSHAYHLRGSYLAARGRSFGSATISGWQLSHGGLLPEEVLVPVVEWFADEMALVWPLIDFAEGASRQRGKWLLRVWAKNPSATTIRSALIHFRLAAGGETVTWPLQKLGAGEEMCQDIALTAGAEDDATDLMLQVTCAISTELGTQEQMSEYSVPVKTQLAERTNAQDEFERMF